MRSTSERGDILAEAIGRWHRRRPAPADLTPGSRRGTPPPLVCPFEECTTAPLVPFGTKGLLCLHLRTGHAAACGTIDRQWLAAVNLHWCDGCSLPWSSLPRHRCSARDISRAARIPDWSPQFSDWDTVDAISIPDIFSDRVPTPRLIPHGKNIETALTSIVVGIANELGRPGLNLTHCTRLWKLFFLLPRWLLCTRAPGGTAALIKARLARFMRGEWAPLHRDAGLLLASVALSTGGRLSPAEAKALRVLAQVELGAPTAPCARTSPLRT